MAGKLEVIIGGMYAAKSTRLIENVRRAVLARRNVVMFKPSSDDRYSECEVVSHDGLRYPCCSVPDLDALVSALPDIPCLVAVDEAQFFGEGLAETLDDLARAGYEVVAAGLDLDFRGVPFPNMIPLVFLADEVTKLRAVCTACGADACRSQRMLDGWPVTEGEVVEVGGVEAYEARCRACFQGPIRDILRASAAYQEQA